MVSVACADAHPKQLLRQQPPATSSHPRTEHARAASKRELGLTPESRGEVKRCKRRCRLFALICGQRRYCFGV
eukprot:1876674-Amphidinium_carterae.1